MSRLQKESSFLGVASTSQESSSLRASKVLRVTLLGSEWRSSKGGLSTINRELAIQLAKLPSVDVSVYLPRCSEEDRRAARSHNVHLIEAQELPGHDQPTDWLVSLPKGHHPHCVIGHGVPLGRQVQVIQKQQPCKWIQVVHTAPEELGMFKSYEEAIFRGEKKHHAEVKLCELADGVVAIGPKLADAYSRYLRSSKKDQQVFNLTPSIFTEFSHVEQASKEGKNFCVLLFGRGDHEDFELKGYDIAVEAIAQLKDKSYQLKFVGAPKGKEEKVASRLVEYGISRSQLTVRCFKEDREQLGSLFYEADLAIMPSRTEGFGLTGLEALSAGLPVLISGNSGLGQALEEVPSGSYCVINSEDPKEWANAIKVIRQKKRKVRLEEASLLRKEYAAKYSWQRQCESLVKKMVNLVFVDPVTLQSSAGFKENESSTSRAVQRKDAVINKSRQASNKEVKRSSSSVATQSVKRRKGSEHCLVEKHLRDEYIRRSNVKPLLWDSDIQLPIDDVYTRLQIKWRRKAYFQLTEKEVHMYEIFRPAKEGEKGAKMVLVEGNPGIGKTTFCLKIARDWAKKSVPVKFHFPVFQLLFLLKCCDIHKDTEDIVQAIDEQLLNDDMKNREDFLDYIRDGKNQDKILLILDGLDELPEASEKVIDRLFKRKIFSRCFILATSREEKGIYVRRRYDFDTLLQIKGFTSEDATDYIRNHFKIVDPQNVSKGERLIQAVEENTYLDALRNNPLNLLLLCVVFEDFEGELPSNCTKLYQIIFRCLLRRYCSRNGLNVHQNADKALENQFKESILVLGELAWNCLLEDRRSFSEEELDKLEHSRTRVRRFPAIKLGLVFMEASSRLCHEPRHQCHFLHKTFQEFLAAFYLANELLTNQPNPTLGKKDVCEKYRQVFFFVAGILGMEGTVFFKQIGTILRGHWNWRFPDEDSKFLLDLLEESGAADHFGKVVCPLISLPINFQGGKEERSCLRLIRYAYEGAMLEGDSTPVLTTLSLCNVQSFNRDDVHNFHRILEDSQTLTELVIYKIENMSHDIADLFAESVSSSTSLRKVTLKLLDMSTERCTYNASALLSAFSQLNCVALEFFCILNNTVAEAVKVLLKTSLRSLVLTVYGDLDDCLVSSVSEGLAEETGLESLSLVVHGKLSNPGIVALQNGVLRNRTLHSLELQVYGEIPEAWMTAVATLLAANKSWKSLIIHPSVCGKIKHEESLLLFPILGDAPVEKSLTVNVCGELSVDSFKALGGFFMKSSPLSGLQLNIRGKLCNDVVDCLVDYFLVANNSLSSHSIINLCGEITSYGGTALQRLVKEGQKYAISVYVDGLSEDNFSRGFDTSGNFSSVSASFLGDGKATNRDEVFNLLSSASLRTLNLTVNHANESGEWALDVGNGLANRRSLTTFSLTVNSHADKMGDWAMHVGEGLANSSSLTTFSLTVINHADERGNWADSVGEGLAKCRSLTTFSLTVNNHADNIGYWAKGVGEGLAKSRSLTTFSLTVINHAHDIGYWADRVDEGLAKSRSLTTFSLTVINHADEMGDWAMKMGEGLANSSSLTTFSLTVNGHADMGGWAEGLGEGLAKSRSLTTLSLTVNDYARDIGYWAHCVGKSLAKSRSLTTFSLTVINDADELGIWAYDVGEGLAKSRSLTTFSLTVINHADDIGNWADGVGEGLAKSRSLTTFSLTVINHADEMGNWANGVGEGLAKSRSLTRFSLTVIDHSGETGQWANDLSKGLAKNRFLTTINVAFNLCGEDRIF